MSIGTRVPEPEGASSPEVSSGFVRLGAIERWAPWAVGLGLIALGLSIWRAFPPGLWHDDGVYALLGESLKNGQGLRYSSIPGVPLAPKFPPLYPAFLAVWMTITGVGAGSSTLALPNLVLVALTGVLLIFVAQRGVGLPLGMAVAVGGVGGAGLALWRVALVPLSEPLFVALLWIGIWAGMRLEDRPSRRRLAWMLLFATACTYTRTAGIALPVAVALALLARGQRRWAAALVVGQGVLLAPWAFWSIRVGRVLPNALADTLGGYGGWMVGRVTEAPTRFAVGLVPAARDVSAWMATLLAPGVSGPLLWVIGLPPLVVAVWGIARMSHRSWIPIGWLVTSAGLLWVWPFQDARLVAPFFPLLVLGIAYSAHSAGRIRLSGSRGGSYMARTVSVVVGVWAVAFPIQSVRLFVSGAHTQAYEVREIQLARAVQAVEQVTDSTAVLGVPELWSGLAIHTGRRAVPSAAFKPGGEGPTWGSPSDQFAIWDATGVDHLVLEAAGVTHRAALDRLDVVCPGSASVVASWEGGALVRLTWTQECRDRLAQTGG